VTTTMTTRQRLIESASRRFYRDGFREVGLDQILGDVGISKTAFYKHFESKDDLMLAAMREQDRWVRDHFETTVAQRGGADPRKRLLALFDVVEQICRGQDFRGCFFINVAMEFPLHHDPAHVAAVENKRAMHSIVARLAAEAGADEPDRLALELMLLMEGTYVTCQMTGDVDSVAMARSAAEALIDRRVAAKR